jgi:hypothetical protein
VNKAEGSGTYRSGNAENLKTTERIGTNRNPFTALWTMLLGFESLPPTLDEIARQSVVELPADMMRDYTFFLRLAVYRLEFPLRRREALTRQPDPIEVAPVVAPRRASRTTAQFATQSRTLAAGSPNHSEFLRPSVIKTARSSQWKV